MKNRVAHLNTCRSIFIGAIIVNKFIRTFTILVLSIWITPASASSSSNDVAFQSEAVPPPTAATHAHADWQGLWIGVEGLFVFVSVGAPGEYTLEMMGKTDDMKDNITILGRDAEGGIEFERDGKTLLLRSAAGQETGLKWLEDKKQCLMVAESEGFCRD